MSMMVSFCAVFFPTRCQTLHTDLSNLEKKENEWLMEVNPDKCEVIKITKKNKTKENPHCLTIISVARF